MANDLIVVFGGSGFVGKQVVRSLAKRGKRIRVPMQPIDADVRRQREIVEGNGVSERCTGAVHVAAIVRKRASGPRVPCWGSCVG